MADYSLTRAEFDYLKEKTGKDPLSLLTQLEKQGYRVDQANEMRRQNAQDKALVQTMKQGLVESTWKSFAQNIKEAVGSKYSDWESRENQILSQINTGVSIPSVWRFDTGEDIEEWKVGSVALKTIWNLWANAIDIATGLINAWLNPWDTILGVKTLLKWVKDVSAWEDTPEAQAIKELANQAWETIKDPQKLLEFVTENPTDVLTILSPRTTLKWVNKVMSVVKWGRKTISNVAQSQLSKVSGLNQSTLYLSKNKPDLLQKALKWEISVESKVDDITKKIWEATQQLSQTGKWYDAIRAQNVIMPWKPILDKVDDFLVSRGIKVEWWILDFTNSPIGDPAKQKVLQQIYDKFKWTENYTPNLILNRRSQIDDLLSSVEWSKAKIKSVAYGMRWAMDDVAKEKISWLKELDSNFAEQAKFLEKIKKDWLNKDWTLKDSAHSKIANLTSRANTQKLDRLEQMIPWIGDDIWAIRAAEDIALASQNKVWTYINAIWVLWGAALGWAPWAVAAALLVTPKTVVWLLQKYGKWQQWVKGVVDKLNKGVLPNDDIIQKISTLIPENEIARLWAVADTLWENDQNDQNQEDD